MVESIREGDYSDYTFGKVRESVSGSRLTTPYIREIPVRRISVGLEIDEENYQIDTRVALESIEPGESFNGILPRDLENIRKMVGGKIHMRSTKPYDSRTLRRLSRR